MRKSIAAAVIAASAATASCSHARSDGGGQTVSRNYQVGNFSQIEVAGPYEVEVRTGANPGVSARGSQNLLERTIVEVEGDKLIIGPKEHHGFFHFGWSSHGKASFIVTVPAAERRNHRRVGRHQGQPGARRFVRRRGRRFGRARCRLARR